MSSFLLNTYFFTTGTTTTTTTVAPFVTRSFVESAYTASRTQYTTNVYTPIARINDVPSAIPATAIFWMGAVDINSVSFDARLRVTSSRSTTITATQNIEPQDTTDDAYLGGMYFYTASGNSSWVMEFSPETSSVAAGYAGYALTALALTPNDVTASSLGVSSYRNTTFSNKVSMTVTAGELNKEVVIVASAGIGGDATSLNARVRLFDGTSGFGQVDDVYLQDTSNVTPYWYFRRYTIPGVSSRTFSIQGAGDGNDDLEIRDANLLALDTAGFANFYYAEFTGSVSTTSQIGINAWSSSFNIANPSNKHLLLACGFLSGSSNASSFICQLVNITTAESYTVEHNREMNATTEDYPNMVARIVKFTGATNNLSWQYYVETAGTTAHMSNMAFALFDLGIT
jgi:hypothetical protein